MARMALKMISTLIQSKAALEVQLASANIMDLLIKSCMPALNHVVNVLIITTGSGRHYITMPPADWPISTSHDQPYPASTVLFLAPPTATVPGPAPTPFIQYPVQFHPLLPRGNTSSPTHCHHPVSPIATVLPSPTCC